MPATTTTTPEIRSASASSLISLLARMTKDRECTSCLKNGDTPNPECEDHEAWDMESDDAVETLHNLIDIARSLMQPPRSGEPSREICIKAARENYQNDDVEIDDDALLSRAPDAYASWVQAWVYVRYADCDEGGATLTCAKCQKSGVVPWADFEHNPQAHGWNPVGDDEWVCDDCDTDDDSGTVRIDCSNCDASQNIPRAVYENRDSAALFSGWSPVGENGWLCNGCKQEEEPTNAQL